MKNDRPEEPTTTAEPNHAVANEAVPLPEFKVPCRHLRSKEMYYQDFGAPEDPYSSGIYWCGKTQEGFGPDGHSCGKDECSGQRSCYLI